MKTATPYYLDLRHRKDLFEKRQLDVRWCEVNCRSTTAEHATERLGYKAQSDGIWLAGCTSQGQFKPDKPWISDKDKLAGKKKAPKYRSPLGDYDAMLPIHPEDPNYWNDIEALKQKAYSIDGHPCLILTEGFFKAIAGCSNGVPTIALLGVEMGLTSAKADVQGKRYLVPTPERYAKAGFGFIIGFDADAVTNSDVTQAQIKLAHQLRLFKVPVYSITGLWAVEQGKGIDDYIQMNGGDSFKREVLGKAIAIEAWEQQFKKSDETKKPSFSQGGFAAELAEKYRSHLAWHTGIKRWLRYGAELDGIWSEQSDESVKRLVMTEVRAKTPDFRDSQINGIVGLLKADLSVDKWDEQPGLLPLTDGVLDLATMQLLKHAPGYRLLWALPYRWKDRSVGCDLIEAWLMEAMRGDRQLVQLHRAYLKAVVTRRVDLQRYLELLGPGGTGKGTFMRLAMALVGKRNVHSTTLRHLEENRFEAAAIFGKLLLLITDAERYGGEVSQLKAITGQDLIRFERKNVQQGADFEPTCMVIVAANEAVQSSDYTSGLARRRLTIPWLYQVDSDKRRNLDSEFKPYLPGLLHWVLEIPDEEVTSLVRDTSKSIPSLAQWKAESLLETNPLAEWLDSCIAHNLSAKTYVGVAKRDKSVDSPNTYLFTDKWLYASYCEYSAGVGSKAVSMRRFSTLLHDLCLSQLCLEGVRKGRDERGAYFEGLAIRRDGDSKRIVTGNLEPLPKSVIAIIPDGFEDKTDNHLTAETTVADGSDGSDGFNRTNSLRVFLSSESDQHQQQIKVEKIPSEPSGGVRDHQETSDVIATKPKREYPPGQIAAANQLLICQTWTELLKQVDTVARQKGKSRAEVFKPLTAPLSKEARQHLVGLLAVHMRELPRDYTAWNWLPESSRKLAEKARAMAGSESMEV